MRLSTQQISAIVTAIEAVAGSASFQVFLYGSRADDSAKGGDIDLLVLVAKDDLEALQPFRFKCLNEIKKSPSIGDRRIDLKLATSEEMDVDPFLRVIKDTMVPLN